MSKDMKKKVIGEVISILLAAVIALMAPPDGLTRQSMIVLGVLVWAVANWIIRWFDDYVVAMMMCFMFAAFKAVSFNVAFNGFSTSTWWILIGALAIGVGVNKSGLLKRVSLGALRLFPPTYRGQVMAMIGAGTVAAPLIPSTTAKCAITAPIAMGIADQLGSPSRVRAVPVCSVRYMWASL